VRIPARRDAPLHYNGSGRTGPSRKADPVGADTVARCAFPADREHLLDESGRVSKQAPQARPRVHVGSWSHWWTDMGIGHVSRQTQEGPQRERGERNREDVRHALRPDHECQQRDSQCRCQLGAQDIERGNAKAVTIMTRSGPAGNQSTATAPMSAPTTGPMTADRGPVRRLSGSRKSA
jgi:hypothetical protein